MLAVGITGAVKVSELELIASRPSINNVFLVPDFRLLSDVLDSLLNSTCTPTETGALRDQDA